MRVFKITFEVKNEEDEWERGWYFIDDTNNIDPLEDLKQWLVELHESNEVQNLRVMMAEIDGWKPVPVEKKS